MWAVWFGGPPLPSGSKIVRTRRRVALTALLLMSHPRLGLGSHSRGHRVGGRRLDQRPRPQPAVRGCAPRLAQVDQKLPIQADLEELRRDVREVSSPEARLMSET